VANESAGRPDLSWVRSAVAAAHPNAPAAVLQLVEGAAEDLPAGPERDELLAWAVEPLVMAGRLEEAKAVATAVQASSSARARGIALSGARMCAEVEGDWAHALELAQQATSALQNESPAEAAAVRSSIAGYHFFLGQLDEAGAAARAAVAAGEAAGSAGAVSAGWRTLSWVALASGDTRKALELAETAMATPGATTANRLPESALAVAWAALDRLSDALRVTEAARRSCEERGWLTAVPYYEGIAAMVRYLGGDLVCSAEETDSRRGAAGLERVVGARIAAHRGDHGLAAALVRGADRSSVWTRGWVEWTELVLAEAAGLPVDRLADDALAALRLQRYFGPWTAVVPDVARLGGPRVDAEVIAFAEAGARRSGAASARAAHLEVTAIATADRAAAVAAAATFAEAGRPLGQAHALETAASLSTGARAHALLEQAQSLWRAAGASFDAARCADRLRGDSSNRPRRGDAITAAERRVLDLVALGHTNREVGALLFISPRTVQAHLGRLFDKSGVRTRTALVAWARELGHLADADPDADPDDSSESSQRREPDSGE
jgi:DNA-binding CsgD family transcriptional regulator